MFKRKSKELRSNVLSGLQKRARDIPSCVDKNLKVVEKMDRKTYLKYYINVLEDQIREATKVLMQKKRELRKLR